MKKSSVSYRIIVNLKPFIRMGRTDCQFTFFQVNSYQTPSQFPILSPSLFIPMGVVTQKRAFDWQHPPTPTKSTIPSCSSWGLLRHRPGFAAQDPERLGQRAPLPSAGFPTISPLPSQLPWDHIHIPISPVSTRHPILPFPLSPPKTRAPFLAWGGVR